VRRGGVVQVALNDEAIAVEGYDVDQIDYHLYQIIRAGWIDEGGGARPVIGIGFPCLTPAGHDFRGHSSTRAGALPQCMRRRPSTWRSNA
jgi:hypothetical protein